ncbi:MAG: CRISPR-associated helicase Cas3' [Desulfobacteraceae bacterium]|nr:MAG: CRISPR-associated helicase Cas3' [Desulfobacteraceae bacterium]
MNEIPTYFRYWGKAERDGSGYHLLPYHCLDVAAVGWVLLNPENTLCQRLAKQLGVEPSWLRVFFTFFLAIHDFGKFSRAFQGLKRNLSPDLVKANPRMRYTERHDTLGFWLWKDHLSVQFEKLHSNSACLKEIEPWLEIVTGHHGIPPKKSGGRVSNFFQKEDEEAASHFLRDAFNLFLSESKYTPVLDSGLRSGLKTFSWQLAGIAVLADWLGSNQEYFKYCGVPEELEDYWVKFALPSAKKAVQTLPVKPKASRFKNLIDLFPFIKKLTPLQEYAVNEPLGDRQQLFILEDVTGAGKTEAALVLTHRLLSAGLADGLYVALPTMATASAMYHRLGKVYRRLYENNGEPPSLVLAHGACELSDVFRNSVFLPENQATDMNYTDGLDEQGEELSAAAYCNAWLADSRKKALLADVGVGTLDQALLAVLPARHQSLRLFGLGRKVLLVDEVHAYDSYMQKLLDALLEIHARQGGSVILLSATLPRIMRENLVSAFHRGTGDTMPEISCSAYPLVTHSPGTGDREQYIDTREEVKRTVTVQHLDTEEAVIDQIQQAVNKGHCVCWIRNTVKAARKSHHDLANHEWMDKNHLHLFHSRFAMVDRQQIESDTLKLFGEKSNHEDRKGHALIATQVVEQSLDLDFDVLITDLAPIDLIIQRAGRLRRHIRDALGNRIRRIDAKDERGTPVLFIFCPDPTKGVDANWLKKQQEGTQMIYPHVGQLWMTVRLLLCDGKGKFTMPEDARSLIEGVYSPESECAIPESLLETSMDAVGEKMMQQSMASLNALKLDKGYTRSSGDWDEETRIPTRLTEEETVSVALANFNNGKLQPYAKGNHHEWALSAVKIPEREWKKAKGEIPPAIRSSIEALKAEVNALRWLEIFPLSDETAHYYNASDGWQS